jgi:hypothetical protein
VVSVRVNTAKDSVPIRLRFMACSLNFVSQTLSHFTRSLLRRST